jgi:hypothetical protein
MMLFTDDFVHMQVADQGIGRSVAPGLCAIGSADFSG